MYGKRMLLALALCSITIITRAQSVQHNYQQWYTYFGNMKFAPHWAIHFDAQARIRNGFSDKGQFLLRPGIQYVQNSKINYTLGYAYAPTYNDATGRWFPEHRIFEQFIYRDQEKHFDMHHRIRLEQRWVGQKNVHGDIASWKYGNRFRYFNRTYLPLALKPEKGSYYLALQNEIFINLWGNAINPKVFDQNRFLVAPGYMTAAGVRLEAGYMNQFIQAPTGAKTMNHILHLSVLHSFAL
ncbi:DUF2490 domain-containing protein [Chitinophaga parva]|nr:DUF2490 domain-containing protein [Chitinophaga parva]